jgi:tellurite resistance protein TerC
MNGAAMWSGFLLLVLVLLALDLFVFHRHEHEIKFKEAMWLSAFWIGVSLLFNLFIYFWEGTKPALEFLTGYLIEKSLSVDNLFVFILLFNYFRVEKIHQHRILYWGVLGALVMRAFFILAGVAMIERFHWAIYVMGAFLVYTGIKMAFEKEGSIDPEQNLVLKLARKFLPVAPHQPNGRFFLRQNARLLVTPLFVVLLVVEATDLVFAVDSIPAILAISRDPFIVFSSNVFAILGLRALYFALAGVITLFHYLKYGLSLVLAFIGVKMLVSHFFSIPVGISLLVVGLILTLSVVASLVSPSKEL